MGRSAPLLFRVVSDRCPKSKEALAASCSEGVSGRIAQARACKRRFAGFPAIHRRLDRLSVRHLHDHSLACQGMEVRYVALWDAVNELVLSYCREHAERHLVDCVGIVK